MICFRKRRRIRDHQSCVFFFKSFSLKFDSFLDKILLFKLVRLFSPFKSKINRKYCAHQGSARFFSVNQQLGRKCGIMSRARALAQVQRAASANSFVFSHQKSAEKELTLFANGIFPIDLLSLSASAQAQMNFD